MVSQVLGLGSSSDLLGTPRDCDVLMSPSCGQHRYDGCLSNGLASTHQPVSTSRKVPLLSLPRLCHILGVTFWVLLVKLLSQDPPLCLSTLLNTPSMVGYALGRIPWLQDVALIA